MDSTSHITARRYPRVAAHPGYAAPALHPGLAVWQQAAERFWNSRYYFPSLILLGALLVATENVLEGLVVFTLLTSALLVLLPDLLAALFPILLMMLMGTNYYEDSTVLYEYWWVAIPAVAAIAVHFICYRMPSRSGRQVGGLAAVSAAAVLGGIGAIPVEEYFAPVALYYSLGLGVCMLGLYLLLRAELARERSYAVEERFAAILYALGIFTGVMVLSRYAGYLGYFTEHFQVIYIACRNYFATMMLMALPIPCYFMRRSRWNILGLAFLYAALLLTGSRSALLFGTMLLAASLYWLLRKSCTKRVCRILGAVMVVGAAVLIFLAAETLFASRAVDGELISADDSRITWLIQSVKDFLANPLTGVGLGNMKNSVIFIGVNGSIAWYHNYFAQIIGSMGLIGAAAYAWLLRDRLRLLRGIRGTKAEILILAYAGMLLVSMTNPGEFSPLPGELLVVALFAVAEEVAERREDAPTAPLLGREKQTV